MRIGLSRRERDALASADLTGRLATSRDRLLGRWDSLQSLVTTATDAAAGDPAARDALRSQLLGAVSRRDGQTSQDAVNALAAAILQGSEPGPLALPDGTLGADEAALVTAAIQVSLDDAEALAFTAVTMGAVVDLHAARGLQTAMRRGPGDIAGPGGIPVPVVEPGDPLRVSKKFEIPDVLPPDRIQWPDRERIQLPPVMFEGLGCIELLANLVANAGSGADPYRIEAISADDACPGDLVVLTGTGFGDTRGDVIFPSIQGGTERGRILFWGDTRIQVFVPSRATGGHVGLSIPAGTVTACGRSVTVFQRGSDIAFFGGVAHVRSLAFTEAFAGHVDVDQPVLLRWDTLPPPRPGATTGNVSVVVTDRASGTEWWRTDNQLGGPGLAAIDLGAITSARPLVATITVTTGCGAPASRSTETVATSGARLVIDAVEITQGAQANPHAQNLPLEALVPDRTAVVRSYVHARPDFDWGFGPGACPIRTRVEFAGTDQTVDSTVGPDTNANLVTSSTNVAIPALFVTPDQHPSARITVTTRTPAVPTKLTADQPALFDDRRRPRRIVVIRIGHPALGLPAPNWADFTRTWASAMARLPVGATQWQPVILRQAQTWNVPSSLLLTRSTLTDNEAAAAQNKRRRDVHWADLLGQVRELAEDAGLSDEDLVLGVLPRNDNYLLNGIANDFDLTLGAAITQVDLGATTAHELAHAIDVRHTNFSNPGSEPPDRADPDQPVTIDHPGWDASRGIPIPAPMYDLMSYGIPGTADMDGNGWVPSGPAAGAVWTYQDRWPTRFLWRRLRGML